MIFNTKKWYPLFTITEFFVDKQYRNRGIGSILLDKLENLARQEGVAGMLLHFPRQNQPFRAVIKNSGYLTVNKVTLQMIKPISERARSLFESNQEKTYTWKVPWEQLGY